MKNIIVLLILMLITSTTIGCKKQDVDVQASPTFKSGVYTLQGIEGRIGILAPSGFVANKPNKYMWHFWGTKEELARVPFKVEAIDLKTGEKHQVLLEGMGTPDKKYVWEYNYGLGGPNNRADAHLPSGLELPNSGKWKLNAYLGGELFGSVSIDVK
ncbi:DUF4871 domain-containing protein [Paenibacillus ginsengarvi]|uniref:DUF4871 domain-containing protein n=1 Tax=Paenibacillus ginsengarvi TaxID=400777 RepID=A0A3B0AJM3_9BACL|nr:DUF4871 domain-containing protein [Paenibacillus ginsengarvi]RKN60840.1 DUF4871 domain-containing protein [Paenibacillus ginsengarvi]